MKRDYAIALILCILGGSFGLQHFYVGKIGAGIVSLLFCWTFIPALVSFFELIYWCALGEENWKFNYSN